MSYFNRLVHISRLHIAEYTSFLQKPIIRAGEVPSHCYRSTSTGSEIILDLSAFCQKSPNYIDNRMKSERCVR